MLSTWTRSTVKICRLVNGLQDLGRVAAYKPFLVSIPWRQLSSRRQNLSKLEAFADDNLNSSQNYIKMSFI